MATAISTSSSGRSTGRYPEAPASHLLRNDSTPDGLRFTDVTAELAPALSSIGLVTGAAWHDVDGDDSTDLVVACEWGPISVLRNDGGRLVDTTEAAGLAGHRGWWYGLEVEDVDATVISISWD